MIAKLCVIHMGLPRRRRESDGCSRKTAPVPFNALKNKDSASLLHALIRAYTLLFGRILRYFRLRALVRPYEALGGASLFA